MSRAFFDSNILLYAVDLHDPRWQIAVTLLEGGGAISVQCLIEFASVARRKLGMSWESIDAALDEIRAVCAPIVPLTVEVSRHGLTIAKTYRLSVYDGLIVAAALAAGCDTLWSEDMHDGLVVDGRLTVSNPFR